MDQWRGRKVQILVGSVCSVVGAVGLGVAVAASSVIWPVAALILALGCAILTRQLFTKSFLENREGTHAAQPLHIEAPNVQNLPAPTAVPERPAPPALTAPLAAIKAPFGDISAPFDTITGPSEKATLTNADLALALTNGIQLAALMGIAPSVTAPLATAANIGSGIALFCMLPKDASLIRKAMALPIIANRVIHYHPIINGIFQANSLYHLAKRAGPQLALAFDELKSDPVHAFKTGGVHLFNLASSIAMAADSLGLIRAKSTPSTQQPPGPTPHPPHTNTDTCPMPEMSKAVVPVPKVATFTVHLPDTQPILTPNLPMPKPQTPPDTRTCPKPEMSKAVVP
ncbi:MAG TPA: hypothetical protein VLF94_00270, partial [Chlamydiales bacterium]|nr:hypothetical protein [Chlamydiales bacterium]